MKRLKDKYSTTYDMLNTMVKKGTKIKLLGLPSRLDPVELDKRLDLWESRAQSSETGPGRVFWMSKDSTKICYGSEFKVTFGSSLGVGDDHIKFQEVDVGRSKTFTILEARVKWTGH
ncbi:hypothetical protein OSB04_030329 [Centaurea solstitialis]|uniref:Uncharacterized protein n=1 Tax=Centaurea solstitialis TaxID=347529 RepID=A0AA38SJM7_9ASTR|nr:hypothetical protein OSB04_030329 [Centaurea solstitialis]